MPTEVSGEVAILVTLSVYNIMAPLGHKTMANLKLKGIFYHFLTVSVCLQYRQFIHIWGDDTCIQYSLILDSLIIPFPHSSLPLPLILQSSFSFLLILLILAFVYDI